MTTPVGPYAPHVRVTFSGRFGPEAKPVEQWSFRLNRGPGGDGSPLTAMLQPMLDAYRTHVNPNINSGCFLETVKVAAIGADGKYAADPAILYVPSPGLGGAGMQPVRPPQIALAVSLTTATRGPRGRGRFYLPHPLFGLDPATFSISAADAQMVAQRAAAFIGAINANAGAGRVCIISRYGTRPEVTGTRVGTVLDTIRSRRRSMPEAYSGTVAV